MGKNKKLEKNDKKKLSGKTASVELDAGNGGNGEAKRVLLLRHGQSEANATGDDVPDSPLSNNGREQAVSWSRVGGVSRFSADVVLISPLTRAVQTALFAFEGVPQVPLEICRSARELWWNERQNTPGTPAQMRKLLERLPRGGDVQGVDEGLIPQHDEPASERDSVRHLEALLAERPETTLVVVCHWGIIHELCGQSASNCEMLQCTYKQSGKLKVIDRHPPPGGPRTC